MEAQKHTKRNSLSLTHSKSAPWPLYSTWRHCATRIQNLTNGTTHSQICTRRSSGTNSLSNSNSLSLSRSFRSDSQLFILLISRLSLSTYICMCSLFMCLIAWFWMLGFLCGSLGLVSLEILSWVWRIWGFKGFVV